MQARVAGELQQLSSGAAIEEMIADYQVMRDQARNCTRIRLAFSSLSWYQSHQFDKVGAVALTLYMQIRVPHQFPYGEVKSEWKQCRMLNDLRKS